MKRHEGRYAVAKDGVLVGIDDSRGNQFYIRKNGISSIKKIKCDRYEITRKYRLVAMWLVGLCECDDISEELLKQVLARLCEATVTSVNDNNQSVLAEETGYQLDTEHIVVSVDFEIKELLNIKCADELPC